MSCGHDICATQPLPGRRLAGFLTLSLLLHATVITATSWLVPTAVTTNVLGERLLVVELGEITQAAHPGQRLKPAEPHTSRPAETETNPGESSPAAPSINHLLGEIQTRLSRYLSYPPLARSRGWQGTVTIGFDLVPDGRLQRIHVARSSGYDLLDRAAIDALTRVGRLDGDVRNAADTTLAMRLPVIYRLTER